MSEDKRFKLKVQNDKGTYGAISENGRLMKMGEVVETLNRLYVENHDLKHEMGELGRIHAEEINKIEDEFDEEILQLEKENAEYKIKVIKILRNHYLECKKWNDTHAMIIIKQICEDL